MDWADQLESAHLAPEQYQSLLQYGSELAERQLPVIFDLPHLAFQIGVQPKSLSELVNRTDRFYRTFEIRKRTGGFRTISAPYPSLLEIQRWLNNEILQRIPIHETVHGFVIGKSIVSNAKLHLKQHSLLRIDIEDFFGSIPIKRVIGVFRWLGYTPSVSYGLAALCCLRERLPQGAATSPALSNIVANKMDRRLSALAATCRLIYTRYADDLIFTGESISLATVQLAKAIVIQEGFRVNERKTFLAEGNAKKIVTGISVSSGRLKLPRQTRRRLRLELHYLLVKGIEGHLASRKLFDPLYVDSLLGKYQFWRQVEPENSHVLHAISILRRVLSRINEGVLGPYPDLRFELGNSRDASP